MTTGNATPPPTTPAPETKREESEDAFRKFLEEVELDEDDERAIKERIAQVSGEGEPLIDDDE